MVIIETEAGHIPEAVKARLNISDDRSLYLLYAHMQDDSLRVALGQEVTACQTIGQVGKSGNAGAAHLHLENRIGPPGMQMAGFAMYTEDRRPAASAKIIAGGLPAAISGILTRCGLLLYEFGYDPTPVRPDRRSY